MLILSSRTTNVPTRFSFTITENNIDTFCDTVYFGRSLDRSIRAVYAAFNDMSSAPNLSVDMVYDVYDGHRSGVKITIDQSQEHWVYANVDALWMWTIKAALDPYNDYTIGVSRLRHLDWSNSEAIVACFTPEGAKQSYLNVNKQMGKGKRYNEMFRTFLYRLITHAAGQPQQSEAA